MGAIANLSTDDTAETIHEDFIYTLGRARRALTPRALWLILRHSRWWSTPWTRPKGNSPMTP